MVHIVMIVVLFILLWVYCVICIPGLIVISNLKKLHNLFIFWFSIIFFVFSFWDSYYIFIFSFPRFSYVYHIWNESPVQVRCLILDAWGWCTGTTQRDGMGREEGGGFRMGNTCIPVADSCWYMAKSIQYCKVK